MRSKSSIRPRTPEEQSAAAFANSHGPGKKTEKECHCKEAAGLFESIEPATNRLSRLVVQVRKNPPLREGLGFRRLHNVPSGPKEGLSMSRGKASGVISHPVSSVKRVKGLHPQCLLFVGQFSRFTALGRLDRLPRYVPRPRFLQSRPTRHRLISEISCP